MITQARTASPRAVRFPAAAYENLLRAARATRDEECCGALIRGSQPGSVERIVPLINRGPDRRSQYVIAPRDLYELERSATILGFYHSHPDGTSAPSARDLGLAWPGYVYVIVGRDVRAWQLDAVDMTLREVPLVIER